MLWGGGILDNKYDVTYTAIQCKFFGSDNQIPKSQVDSFLSDSDRPYFTGRIFVFTGKLSPNAELELAQPRPVPVKVINRSELEEVNINWNAYLETSKVSIAAPRPLRPYQQKAVENVFEGFKTHDRGKLVMACGTGKTFTSLKIAERQTNNQGFVLFLVPSLALLSQSLLDWKRQASAPMMAFAVCSDSKVGKRGKQDALDSYMRPSDLNFPATTDAKSLSNAINCVLTLKASQPSEGMTVVFSTYQSLDVIHQAQTDFNLPAFDLVICDEAHRTVSGYPNGDVSTSTKDRKPRRIRGAESEVDDESNFIRVHRNEYLKGQKRLYMTATPKIYGEAAKRQQAKGEATLYSMDDEAIFGPLFHSYSFAEAVDQDYLSDFKVIILAGDKDLIPSDEALLEFSNYNIAKVIGAWKAVNKYGLQNKLTDDPMPMRRVVGFAQRIDSKGKRDVSGSKQFTKYFQNSVELYKNHLAELCQTDQNSHVRSEFDFVKKHRLVCDCEHIDGTMNAIKKGELLDWLRAEPEEHHCKILFNVQCLSEGVDVPALDAVIFLGARGSPVDVVQTVGRVMRKAPGKKRGYIIIPVVTNDWEHPESIFEKNDSFKVVWDVLNALRSLNPDLVLANDVTGIDPDHIEVVCVNNDEVKAKQSHKSGQGVDSTSDREEKLPKQGSLLDFERAFTIEEKIESIIVDKVGRRKEWAEWANDVADICKKQIENIKRVLDLSENVKLKDEFNQFCSDLSNSMGKHLKDDEVIEMLAQHIVIKPVLDELFRGFPFTEQNPIARDLSVMLEKLDSEGLAKTNRDLEAFYLSVRYRMRHVVSYEARQKVIIEIFDNFFKKAFEKLQKKLGIVYTPIEVVDFINHSVNDILKKEFGSSLGSNGVHIMDPFTGTGTFITRMMQSPELISAQALDHKYRHELHAQEIIPLAYYVASINIESVYHDLMGKDATHYERNHIVVLTDTFSEVEDKDHSITGSFGDNSELRDTVRALPLKVIIGNPPYSVGQKNQNNDNQNERYPALENRVRATYGAEGSKGTKNSLNDSYIKAFRWASDRLGEQGVIAFVTNAGWVDSKSANGMRRCFAKEFSSVYVYHLKGNQRTLGELSRKEGGKIFGEGCTAPIAITILVKSKQAQEQGKIYFATVDDYMNREQKLNQLVELGSILNAPLIELHPDVHGDWLNHRRDDFSHFITVNGKKTNGLAIFNDFRGGVKTNRNPWSYNSSPIRLENNFKKCIAFYNSQLDLFKKDSANFVRSNDKTKIKWDSQLLKHFKQGKQCSLIEPAPIVTSLFYPFVKMFLYNDKTWINTPHLITQFFPYKGAENLVIGVSGASAKEFSCLMSAQIPCLDYIEKSQCFPRYIYSSGSAKDAGGLMAGLDVDSEPTCLVINGNERYNRVDAIRPEAVEHFKAAYPEEAVAIDVDAVFYYIYGILHSPDYRETYANNLQKELPRIPRVATYAEFKAFEDAGRKLAKLHVGYESVEPYSGCTFTYANGKGPDNMDYRVEKLKYGKIHGKKGNAALDKSVIIYNDDLVISDIPVDSQDYVVNKKSALDWILDRCYNDYADEMGDERYILNLILRVITVSLETVKIVKGLPPLTIHKLDQ